jgi:serine/threonine-protein kinase
MSVSDLRRGSELLGYRIERILGRGGMGVVYLAHQIVLDRMVALKLLVPELAEDESFRARFLRESKLAASLDHPNIVPVFDAGEVEGRLYIAMRYVEGTDLSRLLDEEAPIEPQRAMALLAPIVDALDAAHAKGLVHRDVKPSNILVDHAGRPYLADFGLSKGLSEQGLVEESHFGATLDYVAPEQIEQRPVGPAADQYALGCVLYECVTGKPPFHSGNPMGVLWSHVSDPPPSARAANGALPEALDGVFAKVLAKEPSDRYATCREFAADAEDALSLRKAGPSRTTLLFVGLAAAVLAGGLAAALVQVFDQGGSGVSRALVPNAAVKLDPRSGKILAVVPTGSNPRSVALGDRVVWVLNSGDGTVSQIDREKSEVQRTVRVDGLIQDDLASGIAAQDHVAWVLSSIRGEGFLNMLNDQRVSAVGPSVTPPQIPLGRWDPLAVAVGGGAIWVIAKDLAGTAVLKVDPRRKAVVGKVRAEPGETLTDVAVGEGAVWFTDYGSEETLWRLDPSTLRTTGKVNTSGDDTITVGAGSVWLADIETGTLTRVDSTSMRVVTKTQLFHPAFLAVIDLNYGAGYVWYSYIDGKRVYRFDPNANQVTATIRLAPPNVEKETYPPGPRGVAAADDGVWVAIGNK